MPIIRTILSQHVEEASELWTLRRAAVAAPHFSLADLAKLDGRVAAHLDGLRIAGEEGWKMCKEQLAANEEGEVFAAGVLACESANPALMVDVLSVVEQEPQLARGLISALWLAAIRAGAIAHPRAASKHQSGSSVWLALARWRFTDVIRASFSCRRPAHMMG